jgi:hypothetical protein
VFRPLRLVTLCALAAAMSLAAVPLPAAAAREARVNFNLTVFGPAPSGDSMGLFLEIPPGSGQLLPYCAPHFSPQRLQGPILPCQGGGRTYSNTLSAPSGTKGFYQFQVVDASGRLIVLKEGSFTEPAGPEGTQLTINATFGTLPNTAVAAPVADGRVAVLPALGILMVLLAAAMLPRRRRAEGRAPIGAE